MIMSVSSHDCGVSSSSWINRVACSLMVDDQRAFAGGRPNCCSAWRVLRQNNITISADETAKTKLGSYICQFCIPKVPLLPVLLLPFLFLMFIHLISSNKILLWALNTMNGMVILISNYGNAGIVWLDTIGGNTFTRWGCSYFMLAKQMLDPYDERIYGTILFDGSQQTSSFFLTMLVLQHLP